MFDRTQFMAYKPGSITVSYTRSKGMLVTATMHSMISWRMFAAIGVNKLMGKRDGHPFSPQISCKIQVQIHELGTFQPVPGFFTPFDRQFAEEAETDQRDVFKTL